MLPGSQEDEGVGKEKSLATYSRSTQQSYKDLLPSSSYSFYARPKKLDHSFTRGRPATSFTAVNIEPGFAVTAEDCVEIVRR